MEVSGDLLLRIYRRKFCPSWTRLGRTRGWLWTILVQPCNILPNGRTFCEFPYPQNGTDASVGWPKNREGCLRTLRIFPQTEEGCLLSFLSIHASLRANTSATSTDILTRTPLRCVMPFDRLNCFFQSCPLKFFFIFGLNSFFFFFDEKSFVRWRKEYCINEYL